MVDVLYKYMTSERALTCLPEVGDGTLRATQPAALNDPFECAVNPSSLWMKGRRTGSSPRFLATFMARLLLPSMMLLWAREQYEAFTFGICSPSRFPRGSGLCPLHLIPSIPLCGAITPRTGQGSSWVTTLSISAGSVPGGVLAGGPVRAGNGNNYRIRSAGFSR